MTPIDELIEAVRMAICDVENSGSSMCMLGDALLELEVSRPTFVPPWTVAVPENAKCLTVDKDGMGRWWNCDFEKLIPHPGGAGWWHFDGTDLDDEDDWEAGYFEIPHGVDWRTMKVKVR